MRSSHTIILQTIILNISTRLQYLDEFFSIMAPPRIFPIFAFFAFFAFSAASVDFSAFRDCLAIARDRCRYVHFFLEGLKARRRLTLDT